MMLTKIGNPRINYLSRVLALPILAATVFAFTLRAKKVVVSNANLDKEITVVVDAGHGTLGGKHTGAAVGEVYEDEINLAIANKIKELNTDKHLKIVLTRPAQEMVDLRKRVDIARDSKADLFISIHVNAAPTETASADKGNSQKGLEVVVAGSATPFQSKSEILASAVQQELSPLYSTTPSIIKAKTGVWVLNHNVCPSVLIECGYITDRTDKEFLTREDNQTAVAQGILQAIERYVSNEERAVRGTTDTVPRQLRQLEKLTIRDTNAAKKETTTIELKKSPNPPLYLVDGKELSKTELDRIEPTMIESINVLKGDTATSKYGKKGENGVIEIRLKKAQSGGPVTLQ